MASAAEDALSTMSSGPAASRIRRSDFKSRLGHALAASGPIDLGLMVRAQSESGVKGGILCNSQGTAAGRDDCACLASLVAR